MYWNTRYDDEMSEELLKLCSHFKRQLNLPSVNKAQIISMLLEALHTKLKRLYANEKSAETTLEENDLEFDDDS